MGLLVTGDDNGCSYIWDLRVKSPVYTIRENYPVTAVTFSQEGNAIYTGGIDNTIKTYDLRTRKISSTLFGHNDTITSLRLSPSGAYLLSNSMDQCLNVWDVRSFVSESRCVKTLTGHIHNAEKNLLKCDWSPDG